MQVAVLQIVGRPLLRLAAGQHPNAGQQLLRLKGLGQIVIRAAVQPLHPVGQLRAGGKHQYRHGLSGLPQLPQDREPVLFGQHHIQNHQIVNVGEGVVQSALAVVADICGIVFQLQQVPQGFRQPHLILYDQNTHFFHLT